MRNLMDLCKANKYHKLVPQKKQSCPTVVMQLKSLAYILIAHMYDFTSVHSFCTHKENSFFCNSRKQIIDWSQSYFRIFFCL